jgi:hypothetical protein
MPYKPAVKLRFFDAHDPFTVKYGDYLNFRILREDTQRDSPWILDIGHTSGL